MPLVLGEILFMTPFSTAMCTIFWRGSIVRMKSIGDIESPCLSPRSCFIGQHGIPFRRILEDDETRVKLIQSIHRAPKPSFAKTSRRYAQENKSKAFAMSSLMKST
jgi:hypothetical protein